MKVRRVFVEKKEGFDVEARHLQSELAGFLGTKYPELAALSGLRILNRYDVHPDTQPDPGRHCRINQSDCGGYCGSPNRGPRRRADDTMPTLTFNRIGRRVSRMVRTRVMSKLSPWLAKEETGALHVIPVSHGEGRLAIRSGEFVHINIPGNKRQNIFEAGVSYFT